MSCICNHNEQGETEKRNTPEGFRPPVQPHLTNGIKFSIEKILGSSAREAEHSPVFTAAVPPACLPSAASSDDDMCDDIDVNGDDMAPDDLVPHDTLPQGASVDDGERFSWLHCTRYKPPKLPRSKRKDVTRKRKLGRNPRVPFTQHQVGVLESKFRQTHYLSSVDVAELSAALNLTETRVKIWFQNRRARERRDKSSPAEQLKEHSSTPVFPDKHCHFPAHSFAATGSRVAGAEEQGAASRAPHPLQSVLQSQWSYYQALQGLYCYRALQPAPLPRAFQYYDHTASPPAPRGVLALRQSAFTPVSPEDDPASSQTPVSI